MKKIQNLLIITLVVILSAASSMAIDITQKEGEAQMEDNRDIKLDDFSWLIGNWRGDGFGGVCDESWSVPSGESMLGTFKLVIDGKDKFYELMTITIEDNVPVLRVKHFNPGLVGWEEKDNALTFKYVGHSENTLEFEGLAYRRTADDRLRITLDMHHKDGTISQEVIECVLIR